MNPNKLNQNVWADMDLTKYKIKKGKTNQYRYITITKLSTKNKPQDSMVSELLLIANEGVAP